MKSYIFRMLIILIYILGVEQLVVLRVADEIDEFHHGERLLLHPRHQLDQYFTNQQLLLYRFDLLVV